MWSPSSLPHFPLQQNPKQRVLREAFLPAQPRSLPRQYPSTKPRRSHLALAATASSPAEQEEDLWQYPDRDKWYLPKFAAADQPDWNAATFVAATQLAPGIKEVTLNIEVSRERVPLRNAYKHVGQFANVRVNGSAERMVPPSSPPVSAAALRDGLLRVRGDMTANETKTAVDEGSVRAELSLFVRQDEAPEVFAAAQGDVFEVGAFQGGGLELRGPIAGVFAFPTVVIFVEGDGIATARALVAAASDAGGLNFPLRQTVKVYYKVRLDGTFPGPTQTFSSVLLTKACYVRGIQLIFVY